MHGVFEIRSLLCACMIVEYSIAAASTKCTTEIIQDSGACYWFDTTESSWQDALIACAAHQGTLAVVDSQAVLDALVTAKFSQAPGVWIGLTDAVTNGLFRWTNGQIISWHTNWADGSPNNAPDGNETENCGAILDGTNQFDDHFCSQKHGYICQSFTSDFFCEESDPKCAPWLYATFEINVKDTVCEDHDVLDATGHIASAALCSQLLCLRAVHYICRVSEESESCRGTSVGYDEMLRNGCLGNKAGTTLLIRYYNDEEPLRVQLRVGDISKTASFEEAEAACKANSTQLLTIHTAAEDIQAEHYESWIALTDKESEGAYVWTDGTYSIYENWAKGHPQGGTQRNCAFRSAAMDHKWESLPCSEKKPFICELVVEACIDVTCSDHGICNPDSKNTSLYICSCDRGFSGNDCETYSTFLVYTYATIHILAPFEEIYHEISTPETGHFIQLFKGELAGKMFELLVQVVFINVVQLNHGHEDLFTVVELEIGSDLSNQELNHTHLNEIMHAALTTSVSDGYLNTVEVDKGHIEILQTTLIKDHCAVQPCGHNGKCTNEEKSFSCDCRLGFEGPICKPKPFKPRYIVLAACHSKPMSLITLVLIATVSVSVAAHMSSVWHNRV